MPRLINPIRVLFHLFFFCFRLKKKHLLCVAKYKLFFSFSPFQFEQNYSIYTFYEWFLIIYEQKNCNLYDWFVFGTECVLYFLLFLFVVDNFIFFLGSINIISKAIPCNNQLFILAHSILTYDFFPSGCMSLVQQCVFCSFFSSLSLYIFTDLLF